MAPAPQVAWAYGPVTSYSLSLREIDTVQNPGGKFVPSVIETIVRKGHLDALGDPLVQVRRSRRGVGQRWVHVGARRVHVVAPSIGCAWQGSRQAGNELAA